MLPEALMRTSPAKRLIQELENDLQDVSTLVPSLSTFMPNISTSHAETLDVCVAIVFSIFQEALRRHPLGYQFPSVSQQEIPRPTLWVRNNRNAATKEEEKRKNEKGHQIITNYKRIRVKLSREEHFLEVHHGHRVLLPPPAFSKRRHRAPTPPSDNPRA